MKSVSSRSWLPVEGASKVASIFWACVPSKIWSTSLKSRSVTAVGVDPIPGGRASATPTRNSTLAGHVEVSGPSASESPAEENREDARTQTDVNSSVGYVGPDYCSELVHACGQLGCEPFVVASHQGRSPDRDRSQGLSTSSRKVSTAKLYAAASVEAGI